MRTNLLPPACIGGTAHMGVAPTIGHDMKAKRPIPCGYSERVGRMEHFVEKRCNYPATHEVFTDTFLIGYVCEKHSHWCEPFGLDVVPLKEAK